MLLLKKLLFAFLCFLAFAAWAQMPPVSAQQRNWLHTATDFEVRLKNAGGATVKLVTLKFPSLNNRYFTYTVVCWNTASACPVVASATVRAYVKMPWAGRVNVTRFVLCDASECTMPVFAPLQAKTGEGYKFTYDRVKALWSPVPSVVAVP
jgi:hypothetical protein